MAVNVINETTDIWGRSARPVTVADLRVRGGCAVQPLPSHCAVTDSPSSVLVAQRTRAEGSQWWVELSSKHYCNQPELPVRIVMNPMMRLDPDVTAFCTATHCLGVSWVCLSLMTLQSTQSPDLQLYCSTCLGCILECRHWQQRHQQRRVHHM